VCNRKSAQKYDSRQILFKGVILKKEYKNHFTRKNTIDERLYGLLRGYILMIDRSPLQPLLASPL